jgi:hypothetical protein
LPSITTFHIRAALPAKTFLSSVELQRESLSVGRSGPPLPVSRKAEVGGQLTATLYGASSLSLRQTESAITGPLYQARMVDGDGCAAVGGMSGRGDLIGSHFVDHKSHMI